MLPHAVELIPSEEVARRSYPPNELPTRSLPYEGIVDVPVPPLPIPSRPITSEERPINEVEIAPDVAFRKPESVPMVNELEAIRLLVEAVPETVSAVVDA